MSNALRDQQQRQEKILSKPPRIPALKPEEFSEEVRTINRELRTAAGLPPEGDPPEYTATVLRYPALFRAHTDLAVQLMSKGMLTARDRELAVLRTGWLTGSPFEWGEHVAMAKRTTDISSEEIEMVAIGSDAPGWGERDCAIIRAVEELHADSMISEETWDTLARHLDYQQLLELPILVGQYVGVAFLLNSLRIRLLPGNDGFSAR